MLKAIILRFVFLAILVIGIFMTGYFVGWRNEVNKKHQNLSSESTEVKKETPQPVSKNKIFEDIVFPDDFFFGTSYSDFQTQGLSPNSDWEVNWDKLTEILKKDSIAKKGLEQEPVYPGTANELYERYREDFDLATAGGRKLTQVHRISLEWARIEPEEGEWDMSAVRKYREIFSFMKKRGIEPMICLNHFPLPQWFAEKGGWEDQHASYYYGRYAEFVAKNIGIPLKIKWWLTFNEPQFSIIVPYGNGSWPPFKGISNLQDKEGFARMMRVASNILDGHRLAYRSIHLVMGYGTGQRDKIMVSFASAPGAFYPYDKDSDLDKLADNFFNLIYTLSLDSFAGKTDRDFIGLNYYGRAKLKLHISLANYVLSWLTANKPFAVQWFGPDTFPQGLRPKEFYPQGLYDLIMKFKDYGLPIVITENGIDDPEDRFREEFMVIHLKAIHDAMENGVNILGYQYWSLVDTWEPGDASFSHFGLIKIDRESNLERSVRPSALTYQDIIKTHIIRKELLEKHKELMFFDAR